MNHTKLALLVSIYRILVKGKKHYAVPSVNALIDLVASRHETDIKRRWAFQCLHDIEALGYINRQERFRKDPDGGWKQIPSLITITLKGARRLFDLGIEGASRLVKEILGWFHAGDKRWPVYQNPFGRQVETSPPGGPVKLGNVLTGLKFNLLNQESA